MIYLALAVGLMLGSLLTIIAVGLLRAGADEDLARQDSLLRHYTRGPHETL